MPQPRDQVQDATTIVGLPLGDAIPPETQALAIDRQKVDRNLGWQRTRGDWIGRNGADGIGQVGDVLVSDLKLALK